MTWGGTLEACRPRSTGGRAYRRCKSGVRERRGGGEGGIAGQVEVRRPQHWWSDAFVLAAPIVMDTASRCTAGDIAAARVHPTSTSDADARVESGVGGEGAGQGRTQAADPLGIFGRYLSVWIILCIGVGVAISVAAPGVVAALNEAVVAEVSFPIAVLVWLMIFPMTLSVDFSSLREVGRYPRAAVVTTLVNWGVQPFLMFVLAAAFFWGVFGSVIGPKSTQDEFVAGAVILGGSPCTAMVFVWSQLCDGNPSYTLVQVALNDVIIFILYAPTLFLFLNTTDITIPYLTIVLSVLLFVAAPFLVGAGVRHCVLRRGGEARLSLLLKRFKPVTVVALLLTLVLIFIYQGGRIVERPMDILVACVPLVIQTYLVFAIAATLAYAVRIPFNLAAPASFIAASNFFELGVGVAISAYGPDSAATLVNVAGVLVEVPVMVSLVRLMLWLKPRFDARVKRASVASEESA